MRVESLYKNQYKFIFSKRGSKAANFIRGLANNVDGWMDFLSSSQELLVNDFAGRLEKISHQNLARQAVFRMIDAVSVRGKIENFLVHDFGGLRESKYKFSEEQNKLKVRLGLSLKPRSLLRSILPEVFGHAVITEIKTKDILVDWARPIIQQQVSAFAEKVSSKEKKNIRHLQAALEWNGVMVEDFREIFSIAEGITKKNKQNTLQDDLEKLDAFGDSPFDTNLYGREAMRTKLQGILEELPLIQGDTIQDALKKRIKKTIYQLDIPRVGTAFELIMEHVNNSNTDEENILRAIGKILRYTALEIENGKREFAGEDALIQLQKTINLKKQNISQELQRITTSIYEMKEKSSKYSTQLRTKYEHVFGKKISPPTLDEMEFALEAHEYEKTPWRTYTKDADIKPFSDIFTIQDCSFKDSISIVKNLQKQRELTTQYYSDYGEKMPLPIFRSRSKRDEAPLIAFVEKGQYFTLNNDEKRALGENEYERVSIVISHENCTSTKTAPLEMPSLQNGPRPPITVHIFTDNAVQLVFDHQKNDAVFEHTVIKPLIQKAINDASQRKEQVFGNIYEKAEKITYSEEVVRKDIFPNLAGYSQTHKMALYFLFGNQLEATLENIQDTIIEKCNGKGLLLAVENKDKNKHLTILQLRPQDLLTPEAFYAAVLKAQLGVDTNSTALRRRMVITKIERALITAITHTLGITKEELLVSNTITSGKYTPSSDEQVNTSVIIGGFDQKINGYNFSRITEDSRVVH